jgi:hypothetical protein
LPRPDWTLRLPQSILILEIMNLVTLADVRALRGRLPREHRDKSTWRYETPPTHDPYVWIGL